MILLIGARDHPVIVGVQALLDLDGHAHALLDTATAKPGDLRAPPSPGTEPWRVAGGTCQAKRPVSAVLVRQARSVPPARRAIAARLWPRIDRMLRSATCPVMNVPSAEADNYSKAHQLLELAAAGFTVPRTLVTSRPRAALQFIADLDGRVLTKGLCSVKTIPQTIGPEHIARIEAIRSCPMQLQEIVEGRELRLTVIGQRAIASIARPDGSYRQTEGIDELPADLVQRCVDYIRSKGLLIGGFDFSITARETYCFEMNESPLISHYDSPQSRLLTRAVIQVLSAPATTGGDILA